MRICLISGLYPPTIGGEERHTESLAEGLAGAGHYVTVLTQSAAGQPPREQRQGVQVERAIRTSQWGPSFGLTYAASVGAFLLRHRADFDLVQTNYLYWDAVAAALAKPRLQAPLVVRVVIGGRGGDIDRFRNARLFPLVAAWDRPVLDRLVSLVVRRADAFVSLNGATRDELVALGVSRERSHLIPNGVRAPEHCLPRPGARRLVCVARLHHQKGIDVLLHALHGLRTEGTKADLTLVGEGPDQAALQQLSASLGLVDAVRFVGRVTDVHRFLADADVFVLPSRFEGLPLALLEAMAACRPVVATAIPGNVDVVQDGVTGLLVSPDDPGALARAVRTLLADVGLADRLAAAARALVLEKYSVDSMLRETLRVYDATREAWLSASERPRRP